MKMTQTQKKEEGEEEEEMANWRCDASYCNKELAELYRRTPGLRPSQLAHCATLGCHAVMRKDLGKGAECEYCQEWFCESCWHGNGRVSEEDACYACPACLEELNCQACDVEQVGS